MNGRYYDWQKTLSYGAEINIIVSERGLGKTYGLRKQCVKDFLRDGSRFVQVVRYKSKLKGSFSVQRGYFGKLEVNNEFPDYVFKTEGELAYIARKPVEGDKPKWELIGYFVALSMMQNTKEGTFVNVKRVIFDEFVIDKRTKEQYLCDEYGLLSNVVDSVAREGVDDEGNAMGTPVKIYLLGNACDLMNPYFVHFRIKSVPKPGYSWYDNKLCLLHYSDDKVYQDGKKNTLVGRMVAGTSDEKTIVGNIFDTGDEYNISKKTPEAVFEYGISFQRDMYGIWCDRREGYIYVSDKVPKGSGRPVLALTRGDNSANYYQVRRNEGSLKVLVDMYYADCIRFADVAIREKFLDMLKWLGVR